ncbi:MAG: hypothetical protein KC421_00470, partial [Anaerolineales bacterium]|nr:hypothetical protein [Anaerolineales bacterium]
MKIINDDLFVRCLDLLESGKTIDAILVQYPAHEAELRPFLETAQQLVNITPTPSPAAQAQSKQLFLQQAVVMKQQAHSTPARPSFWQQWMAPLASLAMVAVMLVVGVTAVSGAALPGDLLYPIKRTRETVQIALTTNAESVDALTASFNQERIREIKALLRAERAADVAFNGAITQINPTGWVVADIWLQVTKETQIEGVPAVGELAMVNGRVEDGTLFASSIITTDSPDE